MLFCHLFGAHVMVICREVRKSQKKRGQGSRGMPDSQNNLFWRELTPSKPIALCKPKINPFMVVDSPSTPIMFHQGLPLKGLTTNSTHSRWDQEDDNLRTFDTHKARFIPQQWIVFSSVSAKQPKTQMWSAC